MNPFTQTQSVDSFSCPVPITEYPNVLLAHGGGGKLMHQLLEKVIYPAFKNPALEQRHDGAILQLNNFKIAFTTDSYVVKPLFFPGGDIGKLSVYGTVNDLAMCGARPKWLSAAVIIEEGLPMETLAKIIRSMREAAEVSGVQLVTGDTKVVDRGKGDGIFINTAGIGVIERDIEINPKHIVPGDVVIINGDLGRHGIAIMSAREGLEFESVIQSDCAPLAPVVMQLIEADIEIHCLRDLTRGGLASALNELALSAHVQIDVNENSVPITDEVKGACEILGFDPLYVANEGRFAMFVPEKDARRALDIIRKDPNSGKPAVIGKVVNGEPGLVTRSSVIGARRILDMLSGEQLPRIC